MSQGETQARVVDFFSTPLGTVVHGAREAIVMVDRAQTVVVANAAAERMFGRPPGGIVGVPLAQLIPPRFRERHAALVSGFDATGAVERLPHGVEPVFGLRANGEEFPAEASLSRVVLTVQGEPQHFFVAVLRDLSTERGLKADVAALSARLRTVLDIAPVAMWIAEGDHLSFANRAARQMLGVPDEDHLVGASVFELVDPDCHADLRRQLARSLAQGDGKPTGLIQGRLQRPDGRRVEVEIATAALPDHGRTVVQMVITDITEQKLQSRAQQRYETELRRLSASVVEAREEERRRIARELHDELGQRLTALKLELGSVRPMPGTGCDETRLQRLLQMIDDTVAAVRGIAADLRPLMLDDLGLNAAVESLARDAAQRMDIEVTVQLDEEDPPLGDSAAIAVYRMVQEALTNVSRHARATDVRIELRRQGDDLLLVVRDNGIGFTDPAHQREGRYGLLGMRERALGLGGRLTVDNAPGGGGRITVRLPLQPQDHVPDEDTP